MLSPTCFHESADQPATVSVLSALIAHPVHCDEVTGRGPAGNKPWLA